jgi:hypothetical protein
MRTATLLHPRKRAGCGQWWNRRSVLAVIPRPGQRVIIVRADDASTWFARVHVGLRGVYAQQHPNPLARIRLAKAKEFVAILEAVPAENPVERVIHIIQLDPDMFVAFFVRSAARANHQAKLGPILDRAGPSRERN